MEVRVAVEKFNPVLVPGWQDFPVKRDVDGWNGQLSHGSPAGISRLPYRSILFYCYFPG